MADVTMKPDSGSAQGQSANGTGVTGVSQNAQSTPLEVGRGAAGLKTGYCCCASPVYSPF